jgi:hypothetical protein
LDFHSFKKIITIGNKFKNNPMESKIKTLKTLLTNLQKNHKLVKDEHKYIGTGNPFSNILIIGKEAAFEIDTVDYEREIVNNFNYWNNIEEYDLGKIIERDKGFYSALYPYKGQILKKDNKKNNGGTSVTWMNYQKLINYINNTSQNTDISFHEHSFITEVNSTPSEKTTEAITDSIPFRKEHVLTSEFFQSFSIVIISGVGYFNSKNKEIEEIFKVKFTEKKFADEVNKKQPYWIHWNEDKKIVINTYQLSINISDVLLQKIAEEIHKSNLLNK